MPVQALGPSCSIAPGLYLFLSESVWQPWQCRDAVGQVMIWSVAYMSPWAMDHLYRLFSQKLLGC